MSSFSRRRFIATGSSCCAYILGLTQNSPAEAKKLFQQDGGRLRLVEEQWGRIELLGDKLWGVVSTPEKGSYQTFCNGGVVGGDEKTLVVESFARAEGASWLSGWVKTKTGKWPTDVVISHYHPDHSGGIAGFINKQDEPPTLWMTGPNRTKIERIFKQRNPPEKDAILELLKNAEIVSDGQTRTLDLGGRKVSFVTRSGHTGSDITVEVADPKTVFCGDLVWNGMFPNYGDSKPIELDKDVQNIMSTGNAIYIPGHGPIADIDEVKVYHEVLQSVEKAARLAIDKGIPLDQAVKNFKLREPLDKWGLFSPGYYSEAFKAWNRTLQ